MKIEEYQKAIKEFCNLNNDLDIYLAGEVSDPGISDLDFLVLDKQPIVSPRVKKFLCGGNVIVYPREHFHFINHIEQFNLRRIQGVEIPLESPPELFFKTVEIIEWLPERILLLQNILDGGTRATLHHTLLILKSIDRSIKNVEAYCNVRFIRPSVAEIRRRYGNMWAKMTPIDESMRKIVVSFIKIAHNAWNTFEKKCVLFSGTARGKIYITDYYKSENMFNNLLLYFKSMASINSILSEKLNERVNIEVEDVVFNEEFLKFITHRWEMIDKIYNWFLEKGYKKGMIKYGWFL